MFESKSIAVSCGGGFVTIEVDTAGAVGSLTGSSSVDVKEVKRFCSETMVC